MKYQPHPYQERATNAILENERYALWLEMGLGKTVATATAIATLLDHHSRHCAHEEEDAAGALVGCGVHQLRVARVAHGGAVQPAHPVHDVAVGHGGLR